MQPDLTLKWTWDMIGKVVIISRLCNTDAARGAVLAIASLCYVSYYQVITALSAIH